MNFVSSIFTKIISITATLILSMGFFSSPVIPISKSTPTHKPITTPIVSKIIQSQPAENFSSISKKGSLVGSLTLIKIFDHTSTSSPTEFNYASSTYYIEKSIKILEGRQAPVLQELTIKNNDINGSRQIIFQGEYDTTFEIFGYKNNIIIFTKRANPSMNTTFTIGVFNAQTNNGGQFTSEWETRFYSYSANSDIVGNRFPPKEFDNLVCKNFYCTDIGPVQFIDYKGDLYLKMRNDYCIYSSNGSAVCRDEFYKITTDGTLLKDDTPFSDEYQERISWADTLLPSKTASSSLSTAELRLPAFLRVINMVPIYGEEQSLQWITDFNNQYHILDGMYYPNLNKIQENLIQKPIRKQPGFSQLTG